MENVSQPASSPGLDAHASHPWQTGHDVEFYRSEATLVSSVVEFLAKGIQAGQPVVVIATSAHRQLFADALRLRGIDVTDLVEGRDAVWLDAEDTLQSFMDNDVISEEMFQATIGSVFARLKRNREYVVVRAYGEMVDVLWQAGKSTAALELERLWNELAARHSFWLLCAYSEQSLEMDTSEARLTQLCVHHRKSVVRDRDVRSFFPASVQPLLAEVTE